MYNAKIEVTEADSNNITIADFSESTEEILDRSVAIVDGHGNREFIQFDILTNSVTFKTPSRDLAYRIDFVATPKNKRDESVYSTTVYFANITHGEGYLLKLASSFYCKGGCNSKNWEMSQKIFSIINNLDSAQRFLKCGELHRAQRLLDYVNEYFCSETIKSNCHCGG